MSFSARASSYQSNAMLNICDADLLGTTIQEGRLRMEITRSYYGERLVGKDEARDLLRSSSIINMVGRDIVSLSTELGIGSQDGIRVISGVPFLLVFKM